MTEYLLNENWQFREKDTDKFETVSIPHTVNVEPLDVYMNKQGLFEYKRVFKVNKDFDNQRVFVEFEAVMMNCKVYVNDELVTEHFGGYLPFSADITDFVNYDKENILYLLVDNRDDKDTPPGKPTEDLDFLYYGGIYRSVRIKTTPQIYFTESTDKSVSWGGVKVESDYNEKFATISIKQNIKSYLKSDINCVYKYSICFNDSEIFANEKDFMIRKSDNHTVNVTAKIDSPQLWDCDNPNLYVLKSYLYVDGELTDCKSTTFGIRKTEIKDDGFYLNDKKVKLFGLNRGQQFPYLGISVSDEVHRREARLLKESRINCLRLAHYPHSPAFIEECDRLGIMVIDPIPGWQFLGGNLWKKRLRENTMDLVKRDRNHPSVIIYEVTPNETNWSTSKGDEFLHSLHNIVKGECSHALTGGDNVGRHNALVAGFDVPYFGKDKRNIISRKLHKDTRLTLKREYGDWGFGGNESTSRVSRGDGEVPMQIQTWNFQFTHNDNYRVGGIVGDLIWESIDHNRGYFKDAPISKSGIYDIFRIPKLSYQFVRSQAEPKNKTDYVTFLNALKWQDKTTLTFYSNCDTLKLYADDKMICEQKCDCGEDVPFDKTKGKEVNDNYWMTKENQITASRKLCDLAKHAIGCMFDGGNCKHMDYPPFTFNNLDFNKTSKLTVKGYAQNELVTENEYLPNKMAKTLQIEPQTKGIPLKPNDNDFIFVYVKALDENGNIDVDFNDEISIKVKNGSTIGHSAINAEIGIAGFMVKANCNVDNIEIIAHSKTLKSKKCIIETK